MVDWLTGTISNLILAGDDLIFWIISRHLDFLRLSFLPFLFKDSLSKQRLSSKSDVFLILEQLQLSKMRLKFDSGVLCPSQRGY